MSAVLTFDPTAAAPPDTLWISLWTRRSSTRTSSGTPPSNAKPGERPRSSSRRGELLEQRVCVCLCVCLRGLTTAIHCVSAGTRRARTSGSSRSFDSKLHLRSQINVSKKSDWVCCYCCCVHVCVYMYSCMYTQMHRCIVCSNVTCCCLCHSDTGCAGQTFTQRFLISYIIFPLFFESVRFFFFLLTTFAHLENSRSHGTDDAAVHNCFVDVNILYYKSHFYIADSRCLAYYV